MATDARRVPRRRDDGTPARAPVGQPARPLGLSRRGRRVDLRGLELPVDNNGLPIHGNLLGAEFDIARLEPGRLRAEFDYGASKDRLRAFPFPHRVAVEARLDERGLRLTTEVAPTADRAVPISFCWHPYLRMPAGARRDWVVRWPKCEHIEVDEHVIPTGVRTPQAAERAPIGRRTFDDHYALGRDRTFSVESAGRTLELAFDRNYPFGQLYVPPRGDFMAIEPMTARDQCARRRRHAGLRARGPLPRVVHHRLQSVTPPRLLPPGAYTGFLGALCVPDDLYWVSRMPVVIVGMAYPGRADWAHLHAEGVGHVVCLTHDAVPYDASPCTATAFRLQDLVSGGTPRDPERERAVVERAATDVVDHVRRGIGVAVHCMGGRGRTGTVVGVALVRLGHDPDTVVDYLAPRRRRSRPQRAGPRAPGRRTRCGRRRRPYPDFRSESVSRIWPR